MKWFFRNRDESKLKHDIVLKYFYDKWFENPTLKISKSEFIEKSKLFEGFENSNDNDIKIILNTLYFEKFLGNRGDDYIISVLGIDEYESNLSTNGNDKKQLRKKIINILAKSYHKDIDQYVTRQELQNQLSTTDDLLGDVSYLRDCYIVHLESAEKKEDFSIRLTGRSGITSHIWSRK